MAVGAFKANMTIKILSAGNIKVVIVMATYKKKIEEVSASIEKKIYSTLFKNG